jgi:prepilin-type N-terminal cleavage/methylation domain-containing protein/prepilin-type processing-associated H-X9-DG protein
MPSSSSRARSRSSARLGFTLVELLVVIGIIAVLISILLPTLSSARKQAESVKCAAGLREIGNAFAMYAMENKGYFPPPQLQPDTGMKYNVNGVDFPQSGLGAYWFNFLAKYVTKTKLGLESGTDAKDASESRRSIFWNCPGWDGYKTSTVGGVNRVQTGYGMNPWPTFTSDYPVTSTANQFPPADDTAFIQKWGTANVIGKWYKQVQWAKRGAERAVVTDSLFWLSSANYCEGADKMAGQQLMNNSGNDFSLTNNTAVDAYRHGKYPGRQSNTQHKTTGGRVGFNILYADGHVNRSTDRTEAFRSLRMRFPG